MWIVALRFRVLVMWSRVLVFEASLFFHHNWVSCHVVRVRGEEMTTWTRIISAPASARAIAIAAPMPRVPPVMRAVLPWREKREGIESAIFNFLGLNCG